MSKLAKIIVTIVVIFIALILNTVVMELRKEAGFSTPGFWGILIAFACVGALSAIWKKPKNDSNKNDNDSILQS